MISGLLSLDLPVRSWDMQSTHRFSRRVFLQQLAAGTLVAPFIARGWAKVPPSSRLNHASFGASGMAWADVQSFAHQPAFRLVALADVDLTRTAEMKKAFPRLASTRTGGSCSTGRNSSTP